MTCDRCDGEPGSVATYANQAVLPLNGRTVCVDWCIHHIVAALNAGGVSTIACCCGHGRVPGRIDLADGRVLRIETEQHIKGDRADEIERLRQFVAMVEDVTATGDGLTPDQTVKVNQMATRVLSTDPTKEHHTDG